MPLPPGRNKLDSAPSTARTKAIKQTLAQLESVVDDMGLSEATLTFKNGKRSLKGKTAEGRTMNVSVRDNGSGYKEQVISVCEVLPIQKRREEVRSMSKEGHSQTVIAEKLGVSQKTISNDLAWLRDH